MIYFLGLQSYIRPFRNLEEQTQRPLYEAMNEIILIHNQIIENRRAVFLTSAWNRILTNTFNYLRRDDITIIDWTDYVEQECKRRIPFIGLGPHDIEYKKFEHEGRHDEGMSDFLFGVLDLIEDSASENCYNSIRDVTITFFDENRELLTSSGFSMRQLGKYFFDVISGNANTYTRFFRSPFGQAFLDIAQNYGDYSFIENEHGELDCIAN